MFTDKYETELVVKIPFVPYKTDFVKHIASHFGESLHLLTTCFFRRRTPTMSSTSSELEARNRALERLGGEEGELIHQVQNVLPWMLKLQSDLPPIRGRRAKDPDRKGEAHC